MKKMNLTEMKAPFVEHIDKYYYSRGDPFALKYMNDLQTTKRSLSYYCGITLSFTAKTQTVMLTYHNTREFEATHAFASKRHAYMQPGYDDGTPWSYEVVTLTGTVDEVFHDFKEVIKSC